MNVTRIAHLDTLHVDRVAREHQLVLALNVETLITCAIVIAAIIDASQQLWAGNGIKESNWQMVRMH